VNFAFSYIVFQINVFLCCVKVSFFSTRLLAQRLAGKHACIMTYLVSSKTHNSNLHSVDKRVRCRHRLVNSHKAWVQHYDRATLWRQLRQHVFLQPSEHNDQTATTDNDTARQLKLTAHTQHVALSDSFWIYRRYINKSIYLTYTTCWQQVNLVRNCYYCTMPV